VVKHLAWQRCRRLTAKNHMFRLSTSSPVRHTQSVDQPHNSTVCAGADMEFLRAAFQLSRNSVYSLHKSSTREFIQRLAMRELRATSGARVAALCSIAQFCLLHLSGCQPGGPTRASWKVFIT
jgi:hypothetical protein